MAKQRRYSGDETADTLSNWVKDQKAAERLAGSILRIENFSEIDPSHPLGGRDGKRDLLCKKGDKTFVVGVYFPRTPQNYKATEKKMLLDYEGVSKNKVDGLIFFTNQHLTVGERKKLIKESTNNNTDIFHLERIASILNSPVGYGVRLEFLDIELSKTEQLSYFAHKDTEFIAVQKQLTDLLSYLGESGNIINIPTDKIQEFKNTLKGIVGDSSSFFLYGNSMIDRLRVPLDELQEFEKRLNRLTSSNWLISSAPLNLYVPIKELEEFSELLNKIVDADFKRISSIRDLHVPLNNLQDYNSLLDETIEKLREIEDIKMRSSMKS